MQPKLKRERPNDMSYVIDYLENGRRKKLKTGERGLTEFYQRKRKRKRITVIKIRKT